MVHRRRLLPGFYAPYQVEFDMGNLIFARRLGPVRPRSVSPGVGRRWVLAKNDIAGDRGCDGVRCAFQAIFFVHSR